MMHARNKESLQSELLKINEYENRNVMTLKEAVDDENARIATMQKHMRDSIEAHEKELMLLRKQHKQ